MGKTIQVRRQHGAFGLTELTSVTLQTIGLILSDYKMGERKCTLVLAPTVAIMQWRNEIEKFTKGFKVRCNPFVRHSYQLNSVWLRSSSSMVPTGSTM